MKMTIGDAFNSNVTLIVNNPSFRSLVFNKTANSHINNR
jgi:hypothetical protein